MPFCVFARNEPQSKIFVILGRSLVAIVTARNCDEIRWARNGKQISRREVIIRDIASSSAVNALTDFPFSVCHINLAEDLLRGFFSPYLTPGGKFRGPDFVPRIVPFVQAEQLILGHLSKVLAVVKSDVFLNPFRDISCRRLSVHARAYDFSNDALERARCRSRKGSGSPSDCRTATYRAAERS
jgi:hypothetical protein